MQVCQSKGWLPLSATTTKPASIKDHASLATTSESRKRLCTSLSSWELYPLILRSTLPDPPKASVAKTW